MVDMGGLDNLIANTAYLQARKSSDADSKELQRRRRSLMLPGPQSCEQLRQALATDFHSLCEQQPIGRRLFRVKWQIAFVLRMACKYKTWTLSCLDLMP